MTRACAAAVIVFVGLCVGSDGGGDGVLPASRVSRLPLRFERNDGQTDAAVKFVARGAGGAVFITPDGLTIARGGCAPHAMTFDGAVAVSVDGEEPLDGVVHYLIGRDPAGWHTNVPVYARAVCRGVWPGIDVAFHGDGREVEYDFEVAPGADASRIALAFGGDARVSVDASGALVVGEGADALRHAAPRVFEEGREIPGEFVALGGGRAAFRVPGHDPARGLLIDPVIAFATYLGGSGTETALDLAVDPAGHAVLTGIANSFDFPRANALPGTPGGSSVDCFITKFNASGAKFLFSTYFGGAGADYGWAVRTHTSGIYVAGSTTSPDFPASSKAYQKLLAGGGVEGDAYVAKLSPAGDALLFSTFLGGSLDDGCRALALDPLGDAYIGGFTSSTDFPTTSLASQKARLGSADAWAAKLASDGSQLAWSTYLGGSVSPDVIEDLAVDALGNTYAAGFTASADLGTAGALFPNHLGGTLDAFVAKLDSKGTRLVATYLGGNAADGARRIALDASGRPHVAGFAVSLDFPAVNAVRPVHFGGSGTGDGFVAVLDSGLTALLVSTFLGGSGDDDVQAMTLGPGGKVFVAGTTSSSNFPTANALQATFGGQRDAFAARLSPMASAIEWSTYVGGAGVDTGGGVAADSFGDAYVALSTSAAGLPLRCAVQPASGGGPQDCYVMKITDDPSSTPLAPLGPVATAVSPYTVRLVWTDPSRNECSLRIERRAGIGEFAPVAIRDTNTISYEDTDIVPDATFAYRIIALNELGESAPSAEATVTTPQTLILGQRQGALRESAGAGKDKIAVSSALRFDVRSSDHTFHPLAEDLEIRIGADADPVALHVPAGDPGWKASRSGQRFRWTSGRGFVPHGTVDVDLEKRTIAVSLSRFDFPTTPEGTISLVIRFGDDAGRISRAWRPLKSKGAFKVP